LYHITFCYLFLVPFCTNNRFRYIGAASNISERNIEAFFEAYDAYHLVSYMTRYWSQ